MIHKITIENFYSIREKQVLDLRLPKTTPDMPRFRPSPSDPSIRLPTVVAFFGPNASGKSTVLRAFSALVDFIANSFSRPTPVSLELFQPFRASAWWNVPTTICVEFDAVWPEDGDPAIYRYELVVEHGSTNGSRVGSEVLSRRSERRFRALFRRDADRIRCAPELGLTPSDRRLDAVRKDASVIPTLAALNHAFFENVRADVAAIQRNAPGLGLRLPKLSSALAYLLEDPEAMKRCIHELRRLDLGIIDMEIKIGPDGPFARIFHEGLDDPVILAEESEGTKHFMAMFPSIFYTLATGRPAVLDEFDSNMHPHVCMEIVRWFQDVRTNPGSAQLFLATHSTPVIDELEKEEIFLVEKKRNGSSQIQALRDFLGVRRDPSIARKYMGGMFGAVPNIG